MEGVKRSSLVVIDCMRSVTSAYHAQTILHIFLVSFYCDMILIVYAGNDDAKQSEYEKKAGSLVLATSVGFLIAALFYFVVCCHTSSRTLSLALGNIWWLT